MNSKFNKVCMVGLGYIGLPTAAVIASRGVEVIGLDVSKRIVDTLNAGKIHIVEPDLDGLVQAAVMSGKFRATLAPESADAFIIAVPTPFKEGHKPDLSYIEAAARSIAPVLQKGNLVILESTSPVGTTAQIADWLAAARPDLSFPQQAAENADIQIAYCPERVLPGKVLHELVENDRIIGGMSELCTERATDLYQIFVRGQCLPTSAPTAEMAKLTENAFRDVNIAFANELSLICDRLDINVWELIRLANRHPRVNILQPGPGVGGHCIAVDPWFIVDSAPDLARVIAAARHVNDDKPRWVVNQVKRAADRFKEPVIACLGLAFKPDIDDLRESPAMEITANLARETGARIIAVEPFVKELPVDLAKFSNIIFMDAKSAIAAADIILLLVNHKKFMSINQKALNQKILIDTRGMWR